MNLIYRIFDSERNKNAFALIFSVFTFTTLVMWLFLGMKMTYTYQFFFNSIGMIHCVFQISNPGSKFNQYSQTVFFFVFFTMWCVCLFELLWL